MSGNFAGGAMDSCVGTLHPGPTLSVEILKPCEMTPAQKTIFHIGGTAFHLALGSGAPGSVAFDAKAIMSSKIAKEWMDLTRVESDLLHIVVENGLRDPPGLIARRKVDVGGNA